LIEQELFDSKPFLLGFKNGVFDMKTKEFRRQTSEDRIARSCGEDYLVDDYSEDPEFVEQYDFICERVAEIMPDAEQRKMLRLTLGSCLIGQLVAHFHIFLGDGSNGKSVLFTMLRVFLGTYLAKVSVANVCKRTTGPNPELANMDRTRACMLNELGKAVLDFDMIRELTGSTEFNARTLYSGKFSCNSYNTLLADTNDPPKFATDPKTYSLLRRIYIQLFSVKFGEDRKVESYVDPSFWREPVRLAALQAWFLGCADELIEAMKASKSKGSIECALEAQYQKCPELVKAKTELFQQSYWKAPIIHSLFDAHFAKEEEGDTFYEGQIPLRLIVDRLITDGVRRPRSIDRLDIETNVKMLLQKQGRLVEDEVMRIQKTKLCNFEQLKTLAGKNYKSTTDYRGFAKGYRLLDPDVPSDTGGVKDQLFLKVLENLCDDKRKKHHDEDDEEEEEPAFKRTKL